MRTSKSPDDYLVAVAKKKPRLQALIDNVSNMTIEEIENLSEALWIRQALLKLRQANGLTQTMRVDAIVQAVIEAEERALAAPKPTYEVRIWDCKEDYIGGTGVTGNEFKLLIETGDPIILLEENIKVHDTVLAISEFDRMPLMHMSKFVGYMTLENYKGFCRALLNQKHRL